LLRRPPCSSYAILHCASASAGKAFRLAFTSMTLRSRSPEALDEADLADRIVDPGLDPETGARIAELNERFESALRRLSTDEAAILRLKFVEGLTNAQIEKALGISRITTSDVSAALGRLRSLLEIEGVDARDLSDAGRISIDGGMS